jgi:predicted dehydrogenase
MARPVAVGVIGAGTISDTYLENLTAFPDTEVLAIGDIVPEAAREKAAKYQVPAAGEVATVLGHPDIEIVVNLTIPAVHAEVASRAISAGKHVWNEKPLALDRVSGRSLLRDAREAGLLVGCAPDTILGPGLQTACRFVEQRMIGTPLTALALLQLPGPESWHPNPAFLYAVGAGPLFDLGPYYLTSLVQVFGPVSSVAGLGSKARERRVIGSGPKAGEEFDVMVPSHVSALVQFESGQSAQAMFSFDSALPRTLLEVNGTEATMLFPDPNYFDGEVAIRRRDGGDWETVATTKASSARGTGVLDMARALREGRPHRAQGALGYHVLDTMIAIGESLEARAFVDVESSVDKPLLLPEEWDPLAQTI